MTRSRTVVALSVWLVLSLALAVAEARPSVIILFGIVAIAAAVIVVALDLTEKTAAIEWHGSRSRGRAARADDQRVVSLRNQLYRARRFGSNELRVTLVELVDDRLLVHRHIDRAADPDAAMAALSPALRELVAGTHRPGTGVRELDRILTDIEAL